jgi:hypothetical protein
MYHRYIKMQSVGIFLSKVYYQALYILIIQYNIVITLDKGLDGRANIDGRFETHSRF